MLLKKFVEANRDDLMFVIHDIINQVDFVISEIKPLDPDYYDWEVISWSYNNWENSYHVDVWKYIK